MRLIKLDFSTANTARLDFHSADVNTTGDYDGRIVCTGGTSGSTGAYRWHAQPTLIRSLELSKLVPIWLLHKICYHPMLVWLVQHSQVRLVPTDWLF